MTDGPTRAKSRRRHAAGLSRIAVAGASATAMFSIVGALGASEHQAPASAATLAANAKSPIVAAAAPPPVRVEVRGRFVPGTKAKPVLRRPINLTTVPKSGAAATTAPAATRTVSTGTRTVTTAKNTVTTAKNTVSTATSTSAAPARTKTLAAPSKVARQLPAARPVVAKAVPRPVPVAVQPQPVVQAPAPPPAPAPAPAPVTNTNASR